MFIPFLILTILSFIVLVVGFVWMMVARGQTTTRSGPDVGAEIMGGLGSAEDEGVGVTLLEKSAFRGTGVEMHREASISYAELKQLVREGNWNVALPPLLAAAGLFCFLVFGAITLWIAMEDKVIATVITGVALFTMAKIARDIIRA